jgi:hypothetical protein
VNTTTLDDSRRSGILSASGSEQPTQESEQLVLAALTDALDEMRGDDSKPIACKDRGKRLVRV